MAKGILGVPEEGAAMGLEGLSGAIAISLVCVLVIFSYALWYSGAKRDGKSERQGKILLPSPRRLLPDWFGFISGHTLLLEQEKLTQQLEGWADKYKQSYELRIMGKRVIVVFNADDINKIFVSRPSKFRRGITPTQLHWAATQMRFIPSMFFNEGKAWGHSRRLIAPSLNAHNVMDMIPSMAVMVHRLCDRWSQDAKKQDPVDVTEDMKRYTHDVLFRTTLGSDAFSLEARSNEECPTYDAVDDITTAVQRLALDPVAQLGWVLAPSWLPWARRAKRHRAVLQDYGMRAIKGVRSQMANGSSAPKGGKILTKIVCSGGDRNKQSATDEDDDTMKDDQLAAELLSFFMAGTGTSAVVLAWALYYLAKRPEMLARCRKEALETAPDTKGVVSTKEQLMQLVYCSAVLKECLRLHPPGPAFLTHCGEEIEMSDGLKVGAGTAFISLLRYPAKLEENFTRAGEFVPERWIDGEREAALLGEGATGKERAVNHSASTVKAFGGGPRECPGKEMAKAESTVVLAAVCARFDMALAPGQKDPPEEVLNVISAPDSVKLVFTEA